MLHAERALGNLGNFGDTEKHILISRSTQEIGMALSSLKEAFCMFLRSCRKVGRNAGFFLVNLFLPSPQNFFPSTLALIQRN